MNWDGLGEDDDDDRFFESFDRISSAVPLDLASSGSDDDDFDDSRMSFVSAVSSASIKSIRSIVSIRKSSSVLDGYGMWMAEPGDINERRKRLLQGMGLSSNKEVLRLASSKVVRTISRRDDAGNGNVSTSKVESCSTEELKGEEPSPAMPVVLVRSRSDGDIEAFSVHPMAGAISDRPPLAEITPLPSDRQVVDWTDLNEMVTAACYTPDGQGAVIGSHKGSYRTYSIDTECKLEQKEQIEIKKKKKVQAKKITGFQFSPSNPSEVLITSADSRIRILNGLELIQKLRGFRNTSSQISASFSPDGKHIISASEDSQVYIWKLDESNNPGGGKGRTGVTIYAHEHFNCKDVSVAIPWPGSVKNEPPIVEIHSKRHSKRSNATPPQSLSNSPTKEDNRLAGASSRRHLPPLPKKNNVLERITSSAEDDFANSSRIDPGIGVSESFGSSSQSLRYDDPSSISASGSSPSQSWSSSWNLFDGGSGHGGQTVQATAWGMVVVTASQGGEIRVYQNFGLPVKVSRQANLFRDH